MRVLPIAASLGSLVTGCAGTAGADESEQCDRPVHERTGAWFCYEPSPAGK